MSQKRRLMHMNGKPVRVGEQVVDFRGEEAIVTGWSQTGRNRVSVKWVDGGATGEYFSSVFDMHWEDE